MCRRVGMADDADSKSVGGNTVWVQVPPPAPRRNGLCSIQKAQPFGWAFLIPLRQSSFSPQNFAAQTFAGAPAAHPGGKVQAAYRLRQVSPPIGGWYMNCAPCKKPGRLAGLFSYRSGICPAGRRAARQRSALPPNACPGRADVPFFSGAAKILCKGERRVLQ